MGMIALSLTVATTSAQENGWDPRKNPTVASITSRYETKYIASRPALTDAEIFPVIGKYESATNPEAASVTITLDAENKGVVWIDGLPQGRVKALLQVSPSTYRIPAQKNADDQDVAEGTLILDKETNALSIAIGKPYNVDDPAQAFAAPTEEPVVATTTKKSKKIKKVQQPKAWIYTGTKQVVETPVN